jgi:hypothetical protein
MSIIVKHGAKALMLRTLNPNGLFERVWFSQPKALAWPILRHKGVSFQRAINSARRYRVQAKKR